MMMRNNDLDAHWRDGGYEFAERADRIAAELHAAYQRGVRDGRGDGFLTLIVGFAFGVIGAAAFALLADTIIGIVS